MIRFEDATDLMEKVVVTVLPRQQSQQPGLKIEKLRSFLDNVTVRRLSCRSKERICDQAILLLDQFYPHLPFKRARYAIDPVQKLRLLRGEVHRYRDLEFHAEMLRIFAEMRDVHTFYRLPASYRDAVAFLPFNIDAYGSDKGRRFIVTNMLSDTGRQKRAAVADFGLGVEVTHWNGVPVERAVKRLAEYVPGGNEAARFSRALTSLTVRSLSVTLPPDEEIVYLQYRPINWPATDDIFSVTEIPYLEDRVVAVPWYVATGMGSALLQPSHAGINEPLAVIAAARQILWGSFSPAAIRSETVDQPPGAPVAGSKIPKVFSWQSQTGPLEEARVLPDSLRLRASSKRFGYIRIRSFDENPETIVEEFKRLLGIMNEQSPDGLILDARSNPGGSVQGAERILQLFTPKPITPASFHFANTRIMQDVFGRLRTLKKSEHLGQLREVIELLSTFQDWFKGSADDMASGSLLSDGYPVTDPAACNREGQLYQGPVVLLIDAASYSATDIFAAGFQDHGIGKIIGVDPNTGGGGAIRWLHSRDLTNTLRATLPHLPLQRLPAECEMGLAFQRSARVGPNAGQPVEDVGVRCDVRYTLTMKDVLAASHDLLQFACSVLNRRRVHKLRIVRSELNGEGLDVQIESSNVDRIICSINGMPQAVFDATNEFTIPLNGLGGLAPEVLSIQGFQWRSRKEAPKKALKLVVFAKANIAENTQ